jgi:anti-anti-sigma factor
MSLTADTVTDLVHDVILVRLVGDLDLDSVSVVRRTLLKSFAAIPEAVICDLAGLGRVLPVALSVFPAAMRVHGSPEVALLLCGAPPRVSALLEGTALLRRIPIFPDEDQAVAAISDAQRRMVRRAVVRLAPLPTTPRRARQLVADACEQWGIAQLTGPATLVVSELVTNAVLHAGTDIDLSVALRGDYLHINVRDTDPTGRPAIQEQPEGPGGRGLGLVDVYASAWGTRSSPDGKTVWAILRAVPVTL